MHLRNWQKKIIDNFPSIIKEHRRFILKAPTGAGKTVLGQDRELIPGDQLDALATKVRSNLAHLFRAPVLGKAPGYYRLVDPALFYPASFLLEKGYLSCFRRTW